MPELPEVETVRATLEDEIVGLKIIGIDIRYDSIVDDDNDYFINNVANKKIIKISRLAKFLIFELEDGAIISHLRMEGKYFYVPKDSMDNKHIHVKIYLDNGYMLCYQDVRKFGRMTYRATNDIYTTRPLIDVGIDPILAKEIEIKTIYDKIIKKKLPIKTVLLDQSIIAGLGNIYVDEVLYASKILPTRLSSSITIDEMNRIIDNTISILSNAIKHKGTTIRSYTSSLGVTGNYQNYLLVHTKQVCQNCNNKIEKIKIGGRGTYYCKKCQE